ncbi:DUF6479 family protein (plasmid) [Streptomyces sp. CA-294286]|uniref:DUF6479 family protein n=1 Tax=Streptomyces sp. CA-294286 TaxID=3240070 RepID=UPI003D8BBEA3
MNLMTGADPVGADSVGADLVGAGSLGADLMGSDLAPLAAEGSPDLWMLVVGILIAALLLGAFWYGSRRASRHRANLPRRPQPGSDSWQSADESTHPDPNGHEGEGEAGGGGRHRRS